VLALILRQHPIILLGKISQPFKITTIDPHHDAMTPHDPRQSDNELDLPLPRQHTNIPVDPIFEVDEPTANTSHSHTMSEDFGEQLQAAQERLLDLRQKQEALERQKNELEDLRQRQDRFLRGRVDIVEDLNKGLTRLDRETFHARKRLELLDQAKESFERHLDILENMNPEHWSRADLRSELLRASSALEDAGQDYHETIARLDLEKGLEDGSQTSVNLSGSHPFQYWLKAGLAFTLPLILVLLIITIILILLSPGS
jgi:hypothetical protein